MDMSSPEMKEILEAVAILKDDKDRGRARLLQLWDEASTRGARPELCALAHVLADTETDVANELEWDLRALEAATGERDAEDRATLPPIPESFLPSMHLSVAEGYRRLGDLERARGHVACAEIHMGVLSHDAYGDLIRGGLRRLQTRLAPTESGA